MDNIPITAYIIIQFKNTSTAIRALLNVLCNGDEKSDSFISLGPAKEFDNSGVIEGFLQVNVPKQIVQIMIIKNFYIIGVKLLVVHIINCIMSEELDNNYTISAHLNSHYNTNIRI
eukprot:242927_1